MDRLRGDSRGRVVVAVAQAAEEDTDRVGNRALESDRPKFE